ncbi:MAG TPA: TonB-dependent receptor [Polyangiaceae bacterium]|nr:TonB-dependent receptor [Polyangiaceae bacterium]
MGTRAGLQHHSRLRVPKWLALIALSFAPRLAHADPTPEVVVEGERAQPEAPNRAREVAGSVVRGERLRAPGAGTKEVLRSEPGVQLVELGGLGAPATASLRGATATQTPIYLAGVRLNDEVGGTANLSDVPAFMLDRIEVYRSHAPLAGDQQGIGGAIYLEPRRVVPNERRAALGGMVGSYGSRSLSAFGGVSGAESNVAAGVEFAATANDYAFYSGNGTIFTPGDDRSARLPNADVSSTSVWVAAAHDTPKARLRLFFHTANREQGAPRFALSPTYHPRVRLSRQLLALTATVPLDSLNGSVELSTSGISSTTRIDDPGNDLTLARPHVATPGERVEQSVLAREATRGGFRFVEQLTVSEERLRRFEGSASADAEQVAAERRRARLSVGAEAPIATGGRVFVNGVVGCLGTTALGRPSCDWEPVTGRLGAAYRVGNFELSANLGSYTRPPTLSELYGTSLLVRGNDELSPEHGTTLEALIRYQLVREGRRLLFFDVSAFGRKSRDLVTFLRTSQNYFVPVNRAKTRVLGSEFIVGATPLAGLEVSGNASLLDPRDESPDRAPANDMLPFLSRLTVGAAVSGRHALGGPKLGTLALTLRATYQSSRYADFAGQGVIPEQASVDVEAGLLEVARLLTTRLRVSNLFDARRFDVVGFPLPGRSLFLSLELGL